MLINENDCDILLPSSTADHFETHGVSRSRTNTTLSVGFPAIVQITRGYAHLAQTLKSSVITTSALHSCDEILQSKLLPLPEAYRVHSSVDLDVAALPTIFTLLTARFHLHRRNLTPVCRPNERIQALEECVAIAQTTAKYISRTTRSLSQPELEKSWHEKVAPVASNMLCLHLWRCILVLCFCSEYDAAMVCIQLSSAIGIVRNVNAACGNHITFFLERLLDRIQENRGRLEQLQHDEEMLAYVSGDAQGSLAHSWVWAGTDLGSPATHTAPREDTSSYGYDEPMRDAPLHAHCTTPQRDSPQQNQWRKVAQLMRQVAEKARVNMGHPSTYYPPPHNPVKRVQLASDDRSFQKPSTNARPVSSSASRISIANII